MKNVLNNLIFVLFTANVFGQATMPANLRATNTLDRLSGFRGSNVPDFLYGIPFPEGNVIGDAYLGTDWRISSIQLYESNKVLDGYPIRYDVKSNEIEINAKNGIKVISGEKVKSFVWVDSKDSIASYYINAKEFKNSDNTPLYGFFEVLSEGALPFLKRTEITVKKADYNMALNVGSIDDKILKKEILYYAIGNQVFKTPSSKKKLLILFKDKSVELDNFISNNAISVNKEPDLIRIFEYYNSIVKI